MVFVVKEGKSYRLMIHGRGYDAEAGPRLYKGATKSFPGGPPWDVKFVHDTAKEAYAAAERLQEYITESKAARQETQKRK